MMRGLLLVTNLPLVAGSLSSGGFLDKRFGEEFQGDLQNILSQTLGIGHGVEEQELADIKQTMEPMFNALPKNRASRVSAAVMRHAVHRYFSTKHGWQVKGFEPHVVGEESERPPEYIDDVLEKRLAENGFALKDLVTVVAVVERMINIERSKAVEAAYYLQDQVTNQLITEENLMKVIHSYMVIEMIDGSVHGFKELDKAAHHLRLKSVHDVYPYWPHTQMHLDDLVHSTSYVRRQTVANPFRSETHTLKEANQVAQQISENFGHWSDHECRSMSDALQEMDPFGRGRVRLTDFYQKSGSAWQFRESVAYLRSIGALDESSPALGPQVIIPNYVLGMANCITSTPYFSVCCVNQCQPFLQKIEETVRTPEAPAAILADVVSDLSYILGEPKNISKHLFARLEQIAEMNHGLVPLHGRLFSQWLHFTFPRECPYPHLAGTTQPATVEEYELLLGENAATVSEEDADALAAEASKSKVTDFSQSSKAGDAAWEMTEELLAASTPSDDKAFDAATVLRIIVGLCLLLGFGRMAMKMFQDAFVPEKTQIKKAIV
jgi:hypothetical protein